VLAYLDDDLQRLLRTNSCEGCDLSSANLRNADLKDVNLSRADLREADLRAADLDRANIDGSNLSGANLSHACLTGVHLSSALLHGSNLSGVDLTGVDLSGMDLNGTNLSGAVLGDSNLSGTNLSGANLTGTILVNSNLSDANLVGANLSAAYLYGTKLINADLTKANLDDARFSNADLTGANLTGADLTVSKSSWRVSPTNETAIAIKKLSESYAAITSFDLHDHLFYMTSKTGKLYKLNNVGQSQYRDYVQIYPDLLAAYKKDDSNRSIEVWGKWHWENHGLNKGKQLPIYGIYVRNYPDLLAAYEKNGGNETIETWGKRHWERFGRSEGRSLQPIEMFKVVLDLRNDPTFENLQEVGLLSVVSNKNYVYISYTVRDIGTERRFLKIEEYTHQLERVRTILKIRTDRVAHVAGTLVLGDSDQLYVSVGEGGPGASGVDFQSQDLDSLLGKILRIDVSQTNPEPEIIAYGLRNPWKISIDSKNRMFIGDCGEATIESVYLLDDLYPTTPYNLGWPVFEGTKRLWDDPLRFEDTLAPIYEYRHHAEIGGCVIGGYFLDDLGVYIFGDYLGQIRVIKESEEGKWYEIHSQNTPMQPSTSMLSRVLSLGYSREDNKLYMSSWIGIFQLEISSKTISGLPKVIYCRTTMPDETINNSGC